MDVLKREKKKFFFCNAIAQIISETCGISRKQILKIKKSLLQL